MLFKLWFALCVIGLSLWEFRRFPWVCTKTWPDKVFTVVLLVLSSTCMAILANVFLFFLLVAICSN